MDESEYLRVRYGDVIGYPIYRIEGDGHVVVVVMMLTRMRSVMMFVVWLVMMFMEI